MDSNHRHVSSGGQAAYCPITPPQSTPANPLIMHYAARTPLTHALKVRPPPPRLTGSRPRHTRWSPLNRQPSRGLISWFLGYGGFISSLSGSLHPLLHLQLCLASLSTVCPLPVQFLDISIPGRDTQPAQPRPDVAQSLLFLANRRPWIAVSSPRSHPASIRRQRARSVACLDAVRSSPDAPRHWSSCTCDFDVVSS